MRKKILLIGSCGFLLSNFLRKNLFHKEHDHLYIGLDKWTERHSSYNRYQHHLYKHYLGDVLDHELLTTIFKYERPDIVIFGPKTSSLDSLAKVKLEGLQNILKLDTQFPLEKIIYLSNTDVYGHCNEYVDEYHPLNPKNYNAAIDYAAEKLLIEYSSTVDYTIARVSWVYGQRMNPTDRLARWLYDTSVKNVIILDHQGLSEYDMLHIDDFCSGLNAIIGTGKNREVYNLSAGASVSELEIVNEIFKHMNCSMEQLSFGKIFNPNRSWQELHQISNQKLQQLGWKPDLKWRTNLQETIAWYKANSWVNKLYGS